MLKIKFPIFVVQYKNGHVTNTDMNSFKELSTNRRSHRKFTQDPVSEEDLKTILGAALKSPSAKGLRKWHFIVTRDREKIFNLGDIRPMGSLFVAGAPAVVAVLGKPDEQEMWIEDGAIAAVSMQYQAEDLGLGSCWCQVRGRMSNEDSVTAEEKVRQILGIGNEYSVLCLIAIGHPDDVRQPQNDNALRWDQVEWK